jgi:hypothetical protein
VEKKYIKDLGSFFFALLPLILLLVILGLSDWVASYLHISSHGSSIFDDRESATEYFWRILWASLFVIIVLYSLVNCVHALKLIIKYSTTIRTNNRRLFYLVIVALIIAVVSWVTASESMFGAVRIFMEQAGKAKEFDMYYVVQIQFAISSVTVMLITFSSCAIAYHQREGDIDRIKEKSRDFKRSFYLTAGYLGLGIVQFFSLFTWASHAVGIQDSHNVLIQAITIGSSVVYTLIFVIMFVPVYLRIRTWTESIARAYVDIYSPEIYNEWKRLNGLYDSPSNTIQQFIVLISPVLMGVLSSALS